MRPCVAQNVSKVGVEFPNSLDCDPERPAPSGRGLGLAHFHVPSIQKINSSLVFLTLKGIFSRNTLLQTTLRPEKWKVHLGGKA
jgi:hypothetical protein